MGLVEQRYHLIARTNIWQALVLPQVDGLEFKGNGRVGPPFSQEDFNLLSSLGANYVVISGPGLFTEEPPYRLDEAAQANLDHLLSMIANADMFATIAFRTGPGKAEWSLCCLDESYYRGFFNDRIWTDPAAQSAWQDMWRYTAERYKDNPIVVSYKLMVEPNASDVLFDISDPHEFYVKYAGSLADWNTMYPPIIKAIRDVDDSTPIIIESEGYSSITWLPFLVPAQDSFAVTAVHQYLPFSQYTHQDASGKNSYPGSFDVNYDGKNDEFNRPWLENLLEPAKIYSAQNQVPIAIGEFGVNRWVPGAEKYLFDLIGMFEQNGWNHAIWEWSTSYSPFASEIDDFNYLYGIDPQNIEIRLDNTLIEIIVEYWRFNQIRPSNVSFE